MVISSPTFIKAPMAEKAEGIASDLPNGTVYSLVEDPINPDLLFAGAEFGLFFTLNGGENWHN